MPMADRPKVVTLCGSTRFYREFQEAYFAETLAGHIVLSVGVYPHASQEVHGHQIELTPDQKAALDQLHLRKIDMSDEIVVITVEGYLGESTHREITYARQHGKDVRFRLWVADGVRARVEA
jgi:hypothetical protein